MTLLQETIHKHKVPERAKIVKALSSQVGYQDSPRRKSLLQNRPWMSTMLPYCFFSLHDTAYSEVKYIVFSQNPCSIYNLATRWDI